MISTRRRFLKGFAGASIVGIAGCQSQGQDVFKWNLDNVPFDVFVSGATYGDSKAFSVCWKPVVSDEEGFGHYALPPWKDIEKIEEEEPDLSPYEMDGTKLWFFETKEYSLESWLDYFESEDIFIPENAVYHTVESFSLPLTVPFYNISSQFQLEQTGSFTCVGRNNKK